jgi:hypothetical protein
VNETVIRSIEACGRLWPAVVLSIGLAGCAPLVDMDEPSAQGPRISHLRFVPAGTRAGCPVEVRFRLDMAREDVVSAKCEWVRRHGRSAEHGHSTLAVEAEATRTGQTGEIEARFTPSDSGTYYYYVQVGDRSGRLSNVLRGTLAVDRSWTESAPPCPRPSR